MPSSLQASAVAPTPARTYSTLRGIILGLAIAVGINVLDPVAEYRVRSSTLAISHFPLSLFFSVAFLAFFLNPALRRLGLKGIPQPEILIALAIGFVGSSVSRMAYGLLATISAPHYFATPENQWTAYAAPYLKSWMFPTNDAGQMEGFFRGIPDGNAIPWGAWVGPLFWWLSFITAILLTCVFAAVVLRKQWVERERLPYPMAQVPIELTDEGPAGLSLPEVARSGLFWAGAAVPLVLILWNILSYFSPRFPEASFIVGYPSVSLGRNFPAVFTKFDFYVIGFAFFTSLDVLFSIWFFHVLAVVQGGLASRMGIGAPDAVMAGQMGGGMMAFILWGLWLARHQIRDAWRKAFNPDLDIDDSDELVSYRTAVWGSMICFVFMWGWLIAAGLSWFIIPFYLILGLLIYLAMGKIIASTGLVSVRYSMGPGHHFGSLLGVPIIGLHNRSIMAIMVALNSISKGFAMPSAANAIRLGDEFRADKRRVGGAVITGGILGLLACTFTVIVLAYGHGAQNFGGGYTSGNRWVFNFLVRIGLNPPPAETLTIQTFILGGAITSLLSYLTYRFPWWPLHPVGSTISFVWPVRASAFSVFIAWLVKKIVLQIGGGLLYRRTQKFFLGMLVGYAVGVVISFCVDATWFMGDGHEIHSPPM